MTPRVLVDSNGIMLTIGTFQVSGLLLGNGNSCPADFFDQLRRRILNPNRCSLHYHTSNGSTYSLNGDFWGSDWPLRPCLELDKFRDDLTTNPVTSVYAALGRLKAEYPALSWGEVKELQLTTQCYAFARVLDGKALVAVFNNGDGPAEMEFQLPVEANAAMDLLADTVGAENVMVSLASGRMKVQLPSNYATVLRLD